MAVICCAFIHSGMGLVEFTYRSRLVRDSFFYLSCYNWAACFASLITPLLANRGEDILYTPRGGGGWLVGQFVFFELVFVYTTSCILIRWWVLGGVECPQVCLCLTILGGGRILEFFIIFCARTGALVDGSLTRKGGPVYVVYVAYGYHTRLWFMFYFTWPMLRDDDMFFCILLWRYSDSLLGSRRDLVHIYIHIITSNLSTSILSAVRCEIFCLNHHTYQPFWDGEMYWEV